MSRSIATVFQNYQTVCSVYVAKELLLDEGWTSKSLADGIKFLSLLKCICSQEDASSCLGKGLSARQRSPILGTDYSGRDHITVEDCFWITRLVMKHSFSVSELQTVCSVHVANDPSQVVSVYYVRDSGVVSVEELDSQLPKHWKLCQQMGDSVILCLTVSYSASKQRFQFDFWRISHSLKWSFAVFLLDSYYFINTCRHFEM